MKKSPKSAQMNSGPGFRIRTEIDRPSKGTLEKFKEFTTPDISDMLNRMYAMSSGINNLSNNKMIVGPACTVKVFPGDNLMVHKALDVAKPGDIVVVDAGSSVMNGIIGDLISTKAVHRGISAFVIDGLIRDLPDVKKTGLPVFSRGVSPIGPLHRGPGEINFPISCGGIVVNPGDIIVGDENGVVVVRKDFAEEVLLRLRKHSDSMIQYEKDVKSGNFSNEWVDFLLDDTGCEIIK
jgi:regulator of RNase E activity RraA